MNKKLFFLLGGAILLLLLLSIPVNQRRVLSYGVDSYVSHRALYGQKTATETLSTENRMVGIGAIVVDLRRSKELTDVTVTINDKKTGELIASTIIPKESIADDEFAYAAFSDTIISAHRTVEITLSAPDATNQNPIGLRFDPRKDKNAFALMERVPVWRYIQTTIQNKEDAWKYIAIALVASLFCVLPIFIPRSALGYVIALIVIAIAAFATRSMIISQFGGVSGGDPYNYLATSGAINELKNPFANTKRLPGYPLLLAPFFGSGIFDDQQVMRYIQVSASVWGLIMIALIARALKLSWPVAIVTSAILAFQKDYYFTSLRPEPYSLYTALLLSALFLFFKSYEAGRKWQYILFSISLGYGAMVRQEGFLLAAVIGGCSLLYEAFLIYNKQPWQVSLKRLCWMYLPALVLVAPFFIHNFITYGHPLYTEYFEGDRLQIVDSFLAFQDATGATWGVIGSMWKPSWESLERLSLTSPLFISSAVLLWVWYGLLRKFKEKTFLTTILAVITTGLWVATLFIAVYLKSSVIGNFTIISAAWVLAAIPVFLIETKWKGAVIFLVAVSQILIATWFHPFPKHYQQAYPLIVLMIATALVSQIPVQKKILLGASIAASTLPFLIIAILLYTKLNAELDRYNANTALDSVTYRAARAARTLPTPIGFDQAYLPARLYFDPDAIYFPDEDNPTPTMEQEWLQKNALKTIVVSNGNNVFKKVPESWKKIQEFKAAGKDDTILISTIYSLTP